MSQPTRRKLEQGIYERVNAQGDRLGLEIAFKDSDGKTRRRSVHGGIIEARNALAGGRTKRVRREREPNDVRVTFNSVADAFDQAHVASLRHNSQVTYRAALKRLRAEFGSVRLTSISKLDVRGFVNKERSEGLKANSINAHLAVLATLYSFARDDLEMPVVMPRLKSSERPQRSDDAREHRILSDEELSDVLETCSERTRLFFRTVAETGARVSEVLGLTTKSIGADEISITRQYSRTGELVPLKTRQSRRTIEVTRSLAAELRLAGGPQRIFDHLAYMPAFASWNTAVKRAEIESPSPVIHDLRHTAVSSLIADGWDPASVAARIGDSLETTLRVYAHEFDSHRRSAERRVALEARCGQLRVV